MKASDVFVAGGMPTVTYFGRDNLELEKNFHSEMEEGYKILCVTGPTKSGKTVLCKRCVEDEKAVWIAGGQVENANDFWEQLANNLLVPSEFSNDDRENHEGGIRAFLNWKSSRSEENLKRLRTIFNHLH